MADPTTLDVRTSPAVHPEPPVLQPRRLATTALVAASAPVRLARQLGDGPTDGPDATEVADGAAPAGGDEAAEPLAALLELVDDGTDLLEDVVEESVDLLGDSLGLHRRIWEDEDHDHAQIEVRGLDDPAAVGLRQRLAGRLSRLDGVRWAEVNAITSRVAVAFDGGEPTLASIVDLIEALETSVGTAGRRRQVRPGWDVEERAEHPADAEPVHRTIAIIVGDVASLGWTVVGRAARVARLPVEAAGLVSVVDNNPWLRLQAQRLLGRRAAALALPLLSATANGVAQGPFGTLVDLGMQTASLGELRARLDAWARREPEFYAVHSDAPIDPPQLDPRPVPLPDGPVERWSALAGGLGLGAAGITFAATRDLRLSTDALLASTPKAARLGREAFASVLGRTLAVRGVVPLDGSSLRRLDRIDTVVLDAEVLVADRPSLRAAVTPAGDDVDARTLQRAEDLFDPADPEATRRRGDTVLQPLDTVDDDVRRTARGATARGRDVRAGGGVPLALVHEGRLVAVLDAGREVDPAVEPVVAAIRDAGLQLVVADARGRVARSLGADRRVRTGDDVRQLQADGHGVMVVGRQGHRGSPPPTSASASWPPPAGRRGVPT